MYKQQITLAIITTIMIVIMTTNNSTVYAHSQTEQQRNSIGYQDGVSDCQSGTSAMINGASNAGHHTQAYMEGYQRGVNSCGSTPSSSGQNGENQNSNNREQAQSQGMSQHQGFCVTVFSGCTETGGQSSGLSN